MAKSQLIDEIVIKIAPYVRCFIAGYQNRVGHNSYYGGKSGNNYILAGKETAVAAQNEQDFLKVVDFVAKFVKKEVGGMSLSNEKLDTLIAEVVHTIKFGEMSVENNMKYVYDSDIKADESFQEAKDALNNLESQGLIKDIFDHTQVEGFSEEILSGEYASLKNEVDALEFEYQKDPSRFSAENMNLLKQKKEQAIEILNRIKQESKEILDQNFEKLNQMKVRQKELASIMKSSDKNSDAYNQAKEEAVKIFSENRQLLNADTKYKKAVREMREIKKVGTFENQAENTQIQPGQ